MTKTLIDYNKDYTRCIDAERMLETEIEQLQAELRTAEKASMRAWNALLVAHKQEASP